MCGIAGIALRDGAPRPALLNNLMAAISHSGPDGSGQETLGEHLAGHAGGEAGDDAAVQE